MLTVQNEVEYSEQRTQKNGLNKIINERVYAWSAVHWLAIKNRASCQGKIKTKKKKKLACKWWNEFQMNISQR